MVKKMYQAIMPSENCCSELDATLKLRLIAYGTAFMDMHKNYPNHNITFISELVKFDVQSDGYTMTLKIEYTERKEIN